MQPDVTYDDSITPSTLCPQEYTITRTWTATDACGNSSTCSQVITVDDSTAPTITFCPPSRTIECDESTLPGNTGLATATDNCDMQPDVTYDDSITPSQTCPQEYTITRTWIATDACGNSSTCSQVITVDDSTAPTITFCPPGRTIECDESTLPGNTGLATATDNCDLQPDVTYDDSITPSTVCPQEYTITRTWKATDACGNSSTCSQVITVDDSTAPTITFCPPSRTIECDESTLPGNTGLATATDNCDMQPDVTYDDSITPSTLCPQEYTITRTWTATDACGNSSTCSQVITVDDSTAPTITFCPPSRTIECDESTLPGNTGLATATDNCDLQPDVTYDDSITPSQTCPQEYTITRTWIATDACGNSSTCSQVITVDDSTAPDLDCPANMTIECTASTLPANTGIATVLDNCDTSPSLTYSDQITPSQTCPQEYLITRTWTATDDCGNATNCIQLITVDDSTPPMAVCQDITVYLDNNGQVTITPADIDNGSTDNCTDDADLDLELDVTSFDCDDLSEEGQPIAGDLIISQYIEGSGENKAIEIYNGTGAAINLNTLGYKLRFYFNGASSPGLIIPLTGTVANGDVYVVAKSVADPAILAQADQTNTASWYNGDDAIELVKSFMDTPVDILGQIGVDPGTQWGTGLQSTADNTLRRKTSIIAGDTNGGNAFDPATEWDGYATDDFTGLGSHSFADVLSTTTVILTVTDECGNSSTCSADVTVFDTIPPVLDCPADLTIECDESTDPSFTGFPVASDNCAAGLTVTYDDATSNGQCPQEYTITRTWMATDTSGNTTTCVQIIEVDDSTPPVIISCAPSLTIECDESTLPDRTGMASATDNCDTQVTITYDDQVTPSTTCEQEYTITRTWIATDDCGNSSTCTQVITVDDSTPPVITYCPPSITVECDESTLPDNTGGLATASDNCDNVPTITYSDDITLSETCVQEYTIFRTWIATDDCGNSSTCLQIITVDDSTAPELACPADVTIECDAFDNIIVNGDFETMDFTGWNTITNGLGGIVLNDGTFDPPGDGLPSMPCDGSTGSVVFSGGQFSLNTLYQDVTIPAGAVSATLSWIDEIRNYAPEYSDPNQEFRVEVWNPADNTVIEELFSTAPGDPLINPCLKRAADLSAYAGQTIRIAFTEQDNLFWLNVQIDNVTLLISETTPSTGIASATDNCDDDVWVTCSDEVSEGACAQAYTITRTWLASDNCGNTTTCVQVITVEDTTPPVIINCPADITIECTDPTDPEMTGIVSATDNCDGEPTITYDDTITPSQVCDQEYTITRLWTVTDACGNSTTCEQTIVVDDSTAPVIVCPEDLTLECTDPVPTTLATATDNCSPTISYTYSDVMCENPVIGFTGPYDFSLWDVILPPQGGSVQTMGDMEVMLTSPDVTVGCPGGASVLFQVTVTTTGQIVFDWNYTSQDVDGPFYDPFGYNLNGTFYKLTDDFGPVSQSGTATVAVTAGDVFALEQRATDCILGQGATTVVEFFACIEQEEDPCTKLIIRTHEAEDECGNVSSCVQTIFIEDTVSPEITCPASRTIECDESTLPDNTGLATATDACDTNVEITYSDVETPSTTCEQEYTITRTWTATDNCGNTDVCVQIITVDDSTPPTITCPDDLTLECDESTIPGQSNGLFELYGTDGFTGDLVKIDITTGNGTTIGNSGTNGLGAAWNANTGVTYLRDFTFLYTVDVNTAALTLVGPSGIGITGLTFDNLYTVLYSVDQDNGNVYEVNPATGAATLIGNTGISTPLDVSTASNGVIWGGDINANLYTINTTTGAATLVWPTVTGDGLTSMAFHPVTGKLYIVTLGTDQLVEFDVVTGMATTIGGYAGAEDVRGLAFVGSAVPFATATDNCDPSVSITYDDQIAPSQTCPQEYTITRTWTATDDCGNSSTCSQTITVDDSTPPTITFCPENVTIECDESILPDNTGLATATDNCDSAPDVTYSDNISPSQTCPQEYTITRTWTATDACGNATNCIQIITVDDSTPPTITYCPVNVTIECDESTLPGRTGLATATDNCDSAPDVTYSDNVAPSQTCPQEYTITRTWTATDACGNATYCIQVITVDDSTPPVITNCPADITIECTDPTDPEMTGFVSATDNCDGEPSITYDDSITASEVCDQEYTITRLWTVTDACGNSTTCVQTIEVDDSTPPVITCPVDLTLECTDPVPTTLATASDNCSPTVSVTYSDIMCENPVVGFTGPYDFSLWDVILPPQGGSVQTMGDTEVMLTSPDVTVGCPGGASVLFQINVTTTGQIVFDWNYTSQDVDGPFYDPFGYNLNGTFYQLTDNNGPLTQNGTATVAVTTGDVFALEQRATDCILGQGATTVVEFFACIEQEEDPCTKLIIRTHEAEDECGNVSSCVQTIFIEDTVSPDITCPESLTIECDESTLPANTGMASATDACDTNVEITYSDVETPSTTCTQEYTITRTWTATDNCGNTDVCTQIISVDDSTPPTINCPGDVTIECTDDTSPDSRGIASATDNCDSAPVVTYSDITLDGEGYCGAEYGITRTWLATDACGNTSTCIQTITIRDDVAPVCNTMDITITEIIDPDTGYVVLTPEMINDGSMDNCEGQLFMEVFPDTLFCVNEGDNIVTLTVSDACGNTSTCTAIVTLDCIDPCVEVVTWVYLEGSSTDPNGLPNNYTIPMRTSLNNLGVLPGQTLVDPFFGIKYTPAGQPYNQDPWNYPGLEGNLFDSGGDPMMADAGYPATVVDWVLVSLRADSAGTGGPVCQAAALLHNDGHIEFVEEFDCCDIDLYNTYYVVIEHRNHLIVMSHDDLPIDLNNSTITYDFRIQQSYLDDPFMFGAQAQKLILTNSSDLVYMMYAGNGEQTDGGGAYTDLEDTDINFNDRTFWEGENGDIGEYRIGDYNLNGDTNFNDRVTWERNNGTFTSVPRD
jgi:phage tail protein X